MRHIALFLGITAIMAVSCSVREEAFKAPEADGARFFASFEQPADADTKVYVDEDFKLRWTADDRISVFNQTTANQQYRFTGETGAADGEFAAVDAAGTGSAIPYVIAVYPYAQATAITAGGALSVNLPATQTYAPQSFGPDANTMAALSTDFDLQFKNVAGYLRISLYGEGVNVSSVTLKGNNGEKLAGNATVSMTSEGLPATQMASDATDAITLTCTEPVALGATAAESVEFWFAVPPVTFTEGFTVTVATPEGTFEKSTSKEFTITRNYLTKMAPVQVEVAPATSMICRITHLWLWGGTGGEYGGTKVIDLLTKPDYFNNEDGRGVTALQDNYYQLDLDGTFHNYAGEDERNWWFVYSGNVNPQTHKDLDLRKFYDVLPLSEGTYSVEGATLTFTRPDGTSTQATVVGPGTYDMPGTNPVKSVTITTQALKFTISGGVENWDASVMYTDYHAIAGNPKTLFIELDILPTGFEVPAASRTTDDDFKFISPDEPGPSGEFDWTTLPGDWNVYGGNSAPYGIWVLGGSGNDPAFVCPIDKSWCWNDSVKWESDNVLSMQIASIGLTSARATINWSGGADGKFWDYVWKKTGEDLSRFYNKIPKGESTITVDFYAKTVTFANGETAKFLLPGVHEFAYGKTQKIPEGCFGIAFHLGEPIPATPDRWSDVDRFVNAPLEYVLIFEKMQ